MMMNKLYIIGALLVLVYWGTGCQDIPIGYLQTEDAGYNPDTMVVKNVNSLDTTAGVMNPAVEEAIIDMGLTLEMYYQLGFSFREIAQALGLEPYIGEGEDRERVQWNIPWVSNPIEGVQGTPQIFVTIKGIREESGGNVAEALEQIKVYGDGTFEVPLQHTIPVGRYVISLNFRNEGYSKDVDDCFTIIVK